MWENKQYDKLFAAGVPDDFKNIWFIDCVRYMPIEMIYPIYHEIFLKTQIELFGDSVIKKTLNSFDSDVQELIKESEKLQ